jgi:hypothetical protein
MFTFGAFATTAQHTLAEVVKTGPSVSLSLDQLEAVDMS